MLKSGKKFRALHDKKINILTIMLSEKKILNETKNHTPPPFKLNGRSLIYTYFTRRGRFVSDSVFNQYPPSSSSC